MESAEFTARRTMPIIRISKRETKLEHYIDKAASLVTAENVLNFSNQLTPEQDAIIPDGSTITLLEVTQRAQRALRKKSVYISTYRSKWPWSKARAYTDGIKIKINSRKAHTIKSLALTLSHEVVHIADSYSDESFGHGSNSSQGNKQNSAPIMFASLFVEFLGKEGLL